jgi:hypothetical protein
VPTISLPRQLLYSGVHLLLACPVRRCQSDDRKKLEKNSKKKFLLGEKSNSTTSEFDFLRELTRVIVSYQCRSFIGATKRSFAAF